MTTTPKTIEEKYKKLEDVDHVLLRPARYIGSIKPTDVTAWLYNEEVKKMQRRAAVFNPGFLKMFDEIITNSADFSKTPEGKHVDSIRIEVNKSTGEISCYDNGGIPVVMHKEQNMWLPVMLFKELKAGSNFNDEDGEVNEGAGQNGEGAGLTNIFSQWFTVETCDGKNRLKVKFSENNKKQGDPAITEMAAGTKGYTRITWMPDYARLGMLAPATSSGDATFVIGDQIDNDNYAVLYKRTVDIAAINPHLKVYFNGDRIQIRSFKDYVEMHVPEDEEGKTEFVYAENDKWHVGLAHSDDGFQQTSFVNSTHVKGGGTHVEYIIMQICYKLRDLIKKKHKVDVKPSEMRQHMHLFIDCTIDRPRYSEQTKDNLVTEASSFSKPGFEVDDKFIRKVFDSKIIQSVLDWVNAKVLALKAAEQRKLNKNSDKGNPRDIEKLQDATERKDRTKCTLFLTEGDSAAKSIPRDPVSMGIYPLRGKPPNVSGLDELKVMANQEFANLMIIMGLQIGVKVESVDQLRYGKIAILSDQDLDGFHIQGLLMNMLREFWPELFKLGMIYRFQTPLLKVFLKKETLNFYTEEDFKAWVDKNGSKQQFKSKYYKGLGTSTVKEFKEYLNDLDRHLLPLEYIDDEDFDAIDLAFNHSRADDRKVWMAIREGEVKEFNG